MDPQIDELMKRYGTKYDYTLLTERQQELLLDYSVKDNTDSGGNKTVTVRGITEQPEGTLLEITDFWYYAFFRNSPGRISYANKRNVLIKKILGLSKNPLLVGEQTYLFELPDCSTVKVEYEVIKDGS